MTETGADPHTRLDSPEVEGSIKDALVVASASGRIRGMSNVARGTAHDPNELSSEEIEVWDLFSVLKEETDRGCSLTGSAFLEDATERVLCALFVDEPRIRKKLLGGSQPLGPFAARINLIYALGLIPAQVMHDLHIIRAIRNDFAHRWRGLSFESDSVMHRCDALHHDPLREKRPARRRFSRVVVFLSSHLRGAALFLNRRPAPMDLDFLGSGTDHFRESWDRLKKQLEGLQDRTVSDDPLGEAGSTTR